MKPKNQRLILAMVAVTLLIGAVILGMIAMRQQASYFMTPSDVAKRIIEPGQAIRLGGMVKAGTVKRHADGVTIDFIAADADACVLVRYRGIVPNLFRENSGVTADGRFDEKGVFVAETLLAKHDERYVPPAAAKKMMEGAKLSDC